MPIAHHLGERSSSPVRGSVRAKKGVALLTRLFFIERDERVISERTTINLASDDAAGTNETTKRTGTKRANECGGGVKARPRYRRSAAP